MLSYVSKTTKVHLPKDGAAHSELGPLTSNSNPYVPTDMSTGLCGWRQFFS